MQSGEPRRGTRGAARGGAALHTSGPRCTAVEVAHARTHARTHAGGEEAAAAAAAACGASSLATRAWPRSSARRTTATAAAITMAC
eukprot:scaffold842_cov357-Prasinococcus_capsulatus_cf.AAC.11